MKILNTIKWVNRVFWTAFTVGAIAAVVGQCWLWLVLYCLCGVLELWLLPTTDVNVCPKCSDKNCMWRYRDDNDIR